MRITLLTVLIVCAVPFVSELVPETSARTRIDGRELLKQKNITGATSSTAKISPKIIRLLGKMEDEGMRGKGIGNLSADDFSSEFVKVDNEGNVQVYVHMAESGSENIEQLEGLGLIPEIVNDELKIVQGWLPHETMEEAAELGFVSSITPPSYGHTRAGSVTTEGDAIMGSDDARDTFGVDGSGIKVGVISDGVDSLAASQMSGDLPNVVQVGLPGSGDEGTAILEIVHDIAPGAALAFHNGTTTLNFINAINFFRNNGVDVIIDDLGFLSEPFFQDGSVAQAAAQAVADGIVYVSSAGNDKDDHYQAIFLDTDPEDGDEEVNLHDFGEAAGDSSDLGMTIELPANRSSTVVLQWSNSFGEASDDYDLFLFEAGTNNQIDASTNIQNGDDDPIEVAAVTNNGPGTGFFDIVINKFSGEDQTLEIFFIGNGTPVEYNVPEDSVYGHPAAPGVISVGATFNGNVDFFSSEGPSSIFFPSVVTVSGEETGRAAPLLDDRDTPTIVAPNRVSTTVPGFMNFAGTSAAAPHVAGVAALVLQALGFGEEIQSNGIESSIVSTRQVDEVTDIITGTADDLPPAGYDNISGFGSINAFAAVEEAISGSPQPSPSPNPPPTSPPGNNDSDGSGGCSVYGPASANIAGSAFANALILLTPAFVTAFGILRRRKQ